MRSTNFPLQEWFSKRMIQSLVDSIGKAKAEERLWGLLDDRLIIVVESLRERFGKCVINNWAYGGELHQCGFRGGDTTTGALFSAHRYGRAADLHFKSKNYNDIREDLRANPLPFITEIEEDTQGWLHVGVRNHNQEGILWLPNV